RRRVGQDAQVAAAAAVVDARVGVDLAAVADHAVAVGPARVAAGDRALAQHAGGHAVRRGAPDPAAAAVLHVVGRVLAGGVAAVEAVGAGLPAHPAVLVVGRGVGAGHVAAGEGAGALLLRGAAVGARAALADLARRAVGVLHARHALVLVRVAEGGAGAAVA